MIDRENILTWLEICGENDDCSGCCPYGDEGETFNCRSKLMTDALALLKKQEAEQVIDIVEFVEGMKSGRCPSCNKSIVNIKIDDEVKFCKYCEQKVKWG